jgi:RimJ/RimL family protein N-acetyltransferase
MSNSSSVVVIIETERLVVREIVADDAEFIRELLNTPSFLKYIGDRGVRTVDEARVFVEDRYRQSYRDNGYGLYAVELKSVRRSIGMCGFVRRASLPGPDIGFAFLPEFENKGYGFESATAMMKHGREHFGFDKVYAITSKDNEISGKLLTKLGFDFDKLITMPDGEELKLFQCAVTNNES